MSQYMRWAHTPEGIVHVYMCVLLWSLCSVCMGADQTAGSRSFANASESNVLILSGLQRGYPVPDQTTESAYQLLRSQGISVSHIFIEYLDVQRQGPESLRYKLLELQKKLEQHKLSVVIVADSSALAYVGETEIPLFPADVPIVTTLADAYPLTSSVTNPVLSVFPGFAVTETLDMGLALFPGTQRILVVDGPDTRQMPVWPVVQRYFSEQPDPPVVETVIGLSYAEVLARVAKLPPDSLVFYGNYFVDGTGNRFVPVQVARELVAVSNSPVMGVYDVHVRAGLLGGRVIEPTSLGRYAAAVAAEILNGTRQLAAGESHESAGHAWMFQWAQLKRWGVDLRLIPEDAELLNKQLSVWEEYRDILLVVISALILLATLLAALTLQMGQPDARSEPDRRRPSAPH